MNYPQSKPKKKINFRDRDLLFIDIESTGLDLEKHEIVEIGCLLVDGKNYVIKKQYEAKVKPQHLETASREGIKISGYNEDDWKNALSIKKVLGDVVDLAPGAIIAGWKVDFDWAFIEKALNKNKISHSFDYHMIDVISLAYVYFKDKKKPAGLGLRKIAPILGINIPEKHGALVDAKGAYEVFRKLVDLIKT